MLRCNREINLFSLPALDLFASALGAFVILTLILLPYYLKTDPTLIDRVKQLEQQNSHLQQQNSDLARRNESLRKELEDAAQFALLGITTKAKSFVLLIDGAPNKDPDRIIADSIRRNAGAKEIHCVALGDYRQKPIPVTFLEQLAKPNRGGFVGVSN